VLAEVFLWGIRYVSPRVNFIVSPPWARVVVADDVLGHRMSPYYPGNDAWGFRNPAVPDRCDILAIGDSMTYGFAASPENSWPRQLEKLTGKSTYNMSCGSYGFCHYEVLLERGLSLHPTVVIVGVYVGNDFADVCHVVYESQTNFPAKRFASADAGFVASVRAAGTSAPIVGPQPENESAEDSSRSVRKLLSGYSSLYGIVRELRSQVASKQYYSVLRDDDPPHDAFDLCIQRPDRVSYIEDPDLRTVFFAPEVTMNRVNMDDPRIQEGIRIGQAIVLSMRSKVEAAGARFLVLLIPTKEFVYQEILAKTDPQPPEAYSRLIEAERSLTASFEEFLQLHEIEYVNSTSALRACLVQNERPYPESDDGHMNRIGYAAIAETTATKIFPQNKSRDRQESKL
jgi:hypothetical protein